MTRAVRSLVIAVASLSILWSPEGLAEDAVSFDREIRPLLAEKCFRCHGPDEEHREASLRLDTFGGATSDRPGSSRAIVPGNAAASEILRRISSSDDSLKMPPPDDGDPLTEKQQQRLRQWIEAGADYSRHWSLIVPQRPALPAVSRADWSKNAIDRFVLHRLEKRGWGPSAEADRFTLARRLSIDLTGLPPSPEMIREFLEDPTDQNYSDLVQKLLDSPHFGERLAMFWLDAARYSDTDGFQIDATRANWPWRDWVIESFNSNVPFDQFTIEQFAGDLLANSTPRQQLATTFHRNHMTNGEGGRDPEESRIDYVIDRVNTVGTVWLGMTLGCSQCHTHKFDPILQREYYALNAFFNSIDENGKAGSGAGPFLEWKSEYSEDQIRQAETWMNEQSAFQDQVKLAAHARFLEWLNKTAESLPSDYSAWKTEPAAELSSREGTILKQSDDGTIKASGPDPHHEDYVIAFPVSRTRVTGVRLTVLPDPDHTGQGLSRSETGHFVLSDLKLRLSRADSSQLHDLAIASARADHEADPGKNGGYGKVIHSLDDDPRNGWASFGSDATESRVAVFALDRPLSVEPSDRLVVELQQRALRGRHNIGRFLIEFTDQAGDVAKSLSSAPLEELARRSDRSDANLPEELKDRLLAQFLDDDPEYRAAAKRSRDAREQLNAIRRDSAKQKVMVLRERSQKRPTHLLIRGVWNDKGEQVTAGIPTAFGQWPEKTERNRLGLAQWIMSARNPLTSRVLVNHFWTQIMGSPLVRTPEDFGVQGERPTHPLLLDWLAVEFRESGWNMKSLIRLIVESSTYRQSSADSSPTWADGSSLRDKDPENLWLARANRYRLPGHVIRDQQLQIAGLLNPTRGGPPSYPFQPAGVWADQTMGRFHYRPSVGPLRYRRTIYGFWRRSAAPVFLFDSAQRRVCQISVARTNTPLHALTLMNDQTGIEAAIALAEQTWRPDQDTETMLARMGRNVLGRPVLPREQEILLEQYEAAAAEFGKHPPRAMELLSAAHQRRHSEIPPRTLAPLVIVASVLFNLDETMSRH